MAGVCNSAKLRNVSESLRERGNKGKEKPDINVSDRHGENAHEKAFCQISETGFIHVLLDKINNTEVLL